MKIWCGRTREEQLAVNAEYQEIWRERHEKESDEIYKRYYEKNREKILERKRKWYRDNKHAIKYRRYLNEERRKNGSVR